MKTIVKTVVFTIALLMNCCDVNSHLSTDCGPLTPPMNGDVNISSTATGSVAVYSCDQGHVLTGSAARVCGSDGVWNPAPPICKGLPTLPEGFLFVKVNSSTVELLWEHDKQVDLYILEVQYIGPCMPTSWVTSVRGATRAYNLVRLEEGSEYSVSLSTINCVGRSSGVLSLRENIFTDPSMPSGPPQSFRPTRITHTEVTLEWEEVNCLDRNGNIHEYRLMYFPTDNFQQMTTLILSERRSTILGLLPGTSYTFELASMFEREPGPFSTLVVTTSTVGALPTNSFTVNCNHGDLRLVGGSNSLEGRVEVCILGTWGTVCDDFWQVADATVVCRQLGHSDIGAEVTRGAFFGAGTGPILLDNVNCDGDENRLEECVSNGICVNDCSHNEDAGVRCQPIGCAAPGTLLCGFDGYDQTRCWTPNQACDGLNNCRDELAYDEISGFVEKFGITCNKTNVSVGNELVIGLLSPPFEETLVIPLSEATPVIENCIVRGGFSSLDPFTVIINSTGMGATADVDFSDLSGTVFHFGPSDSIACFNTTIIDDEVVEDVEFYFIRIFIEANVNYTFIGPRSAMIAIIDDDVSCEDGDVRLVDGPTTAHFVDGRVEVCFNKAWGTVCDNMWDNADATVVCRQLGLSTKDAISFGGGIFLPGPDSRPIYFDNVECNGTETTLLHCSFQRDTSGCRHGKDAGVSCLVVQ